MSNQIMEFFPRRSLSELEGELAERREHYQRLQRMAAQCLGCAVPSIIVHTGEPNIMPSRMPLDVIPDSLLRALRDEGGVIQDLMSRIWVENERRKREEGQNG